MAGTQSDMRRQAENALNAARKSGADKQTIDMLKARFDAARTAELAATNQNEQMGYGLNKRG